MSVLPVLVSLSLETQLSIREELFKSAATSGLTKGGDVSEQTQVQFRGDWEVV